MTRFYLFLLIALMVVPSLLLSWLHEAGWIEWNYWICTTPLTVPVGIAALMLLCYVIGDGDIDWTDE